MLLARRENRPDAETISVNAQPSCNTADTIATDSLQFPSLEPRCYQRSYNVERKSSFTTFYHFSQPKLNQRYILLPSG